MIVRLGFHPCLRSSDRERASSRRATWPESGSAAPLTQASWWLPRMIHWSGDCAPWNLGNDVADGFDVPIRLDLEMDLRRAGADVVGDRQAAAEFFGGDRAFQLGQQRFGVAIRDGKDGNLGDRRRILDGKALHIALGGDARR